MAAQYSFSSMDVLTIVLCILHLHLQILQQTYTEKLSQGHYISSLESYISKLSVAGSKLLFTPFDNQLMLHWTRLNFQICKSIADMLPFLLLFCLALAGPSLIVIISILTWQDFITKYHILGGST